MSKLSLSFGRATFSLPEKVGAKLVENNNRFERATLLVVG